MKYRLTGEYETIIEHTSIVNFSKEYKLEEFDCGVEDYNTFLINDAEYYVENGISSVHLLIHNDTNDIIGYFALLTDAFLLDKNEKTSLELHIPFSSVPALKIGKLATSKNHKEYHYGCYLLWMALGFARELEELGIACRFLTVDADIEYNPDNYKFYEANGFVINQHKSLLQRKNFVSMRYDLFSD
ncbi:hypothetical protein [Bacillus salipaludis]|uniref:hypothetical protein n=1 Tax=Bacillus salipaludis TaxID=2547811 RepID=UPI002E24E695|nr:hypothetical protein [Bacillus salipaludis]